MKTTRTNIISLNVLECFLKVRNFYFKLLYDVKGNLFSKIPIWITKTKTNKKNLILNLRFNHAAICAFEQVQKQIIVLF